MLISNLLAGLVAFGLTEAKAIQQQNCTLIPAPNPSHNLYCASSGTFAGTVSRLNNATIASSLTDCAVTCRGDSRCISFGFTESTATGNCQLFSESLKHMNLHPSGNGTTIYYNDHCWKKACIPVIAASSPKSTSTTLPTITPSPLSCSACHSYPKKNGAAPLCEAISALKASSAAPFCNGFLSIGTSTFTETQTTIVPTATANTNTTVTAFVEKDYYFETTTSTVLLTATDTYTPTITATATVTSTSTYSCLSTATTLTTSVIMDPSLDQDATSPAASSTTVYAKKFRRFDNGTSTATAPGSITTGSANFSIPAYLSNWDADTISSACGCLKAPTPSITATTTMTLGNGTFAAVQTVTTTPVMNATFTSIVTVFSTAATVISTVDAVTSTLFTNTLVVPTPSGLSTTGLNYYVYNTSLNYNEDDPGFDATEFNNYDYEYSGFMVDVNNLQTEGYAWGTGETTCGFDEDYDCGTVAVVMQGYFYAANGGGDYQLSTGGNVDNALYVWTGDDAYTDYDNDNVAYQAVRAGSGPYYGGSTTLTLAEYELVPVTIMWVNGGGIGAAFMTVVDPIGNEYDDYTAGFFLPSDDHRMCFQSNPFSP